MDHLLEDNPVSLSTSHQPTGKRPTLRISQVLSACSFCKGRKIKCDGVPPACGGCTKFGRSATCSLSTGVGRQARDYPTYLQGRIQKLQSRLEKAHDAASVPGRTCLANAPPTSGPAAADPPFHETPTSVDTLIADIGAVPILASSYSSTGDGPTLSSILLGAASKNAYPIPLVSQQGIVDLSYTSPQPVLPRFPRREIALKLVEHYIDQLYPRLPFFSLQGFWAQFNSIYSTDHEIQDSHSLPEQSHGSSQPRQDQRTLDMDQGYGAFTVLLVLAIASSSLSRSADSVVSSQAQRLFNAALEHRESAVRPNTIIGVQSLLFLIQYGTLNPSVLDAWYLIGMGMRSCIDLGLHQDPQHMDTISPSLLETRRRLWWSMYSFDRSISLGCGRPIGISDGMIKTRLPSFRIESTATEGQIQGYLQRYRALQIQSQIYDRLSTRSDSDTGDSSEIVSYLAQKLEAWRRDNAPSYSQTLVETEWLMGKMLLYRPCQLIPERTTVELRQLWESSSRFSTLYRQLVESNGIFYVQIASEKLYWVGLAMLYSVWKIKHHCEQHAAPIQNSQLWSAVQDVLFSIRTLGERWEDGYILARDFESASTQVISLLETRESYHSDDMLPDEVKDFANYISLASIKAADVHGCSSQQDGELRQLVSDMLMKDGAETYIQTI